MLLPRDEPKNVDIMILACLEDDDDVGHDVSDDGQSRGLDEEAVALEKHLDQEKLALLTNQADILQFRMDILIAMMKLQQQQSAIKDDDISPRWQDFWEEDDEDKNHQQAFPKKSLGSSVPSPPDPSLECPYTPKRHNGPTKSSFLQKRQKTDPLTPETIRKVKFFVTHDRNPEFRWSAVAVGDNST